MRALSGIDAHEQVVRGLAKVEQIPASSKLRMVSPELAYGTRMSPELAEPHLAVLFSEKPEDGILHGFLTGLNENRSTMSAAATNGRIVATFDTSWSCTIAGSRCPHLSLL